eukprot:TRINITY_DN8750_c0_g2_i13.p2 TRINITY_DN8750_c0_g2~~TRINITY_DN8750_c0_g2_i13.p2  ORF type:complete len:197 (-),score=44.15 TRINITY_DN8750_c0_g2_i13:89-679(-)
MIKQTVFPGKVLASGKEAEPGSGAFLEGGQVIAAVFGESETKTREDGRRSVGVRSEGTIAPFLFPEPGTTVLGKVTRIVEDSVRVEVLVISGRAAPQPLEGVIRKQYVRKHEVDKIRLSECFLPGDIVQCRVLSLGDGSRLMLTTAENDLGVVFARSEASRELMLPLSWKEMICPTSRAREPRKVAKPNYDLLEQE